MYLLDTNIWLERMLEQERSEEVRAFLDKVPSDRLSTTDFSLHSIGVILHRLDRREGFLRFVRDAFIDSGVAIVGLDPSGMERLVEVSEEFGLDFDDAYQYVAAEVYDLTIVSFDKDFDRTERARVTPGEIVAE